MIYLFKPGRGTLPGEVNSGSDGIVDNTSDEKKLLQFQDDVPYNNPDGAAANVATHPDFRGGHPQGPMRSENMSGQGVIHPVQKTSAPMSKPFPAPSSDVVTSPSSIKV